MGNEAEKEDGNIAATRILIFDRHPVVRQALVELINQQPDLQVCAEGESGEETLEICGKQRIDLGIIESSPDSNFEMQLVGDLQSRYPELPVIMLSRSERASNCAAAFRAGIRGYVLKHEMAGTIIPAIRRVLNGEIYVSGSMAAKMARAGMSSVSDFASRPNGTQS